MKQTSENKSKPGVVGARKVLEMLKERADSYKSNSMYPAFGLNSRVDECCDIANEISQLFGIPSSLPADAD